MLVDRLWKEMHASEQAQQRKQLSRQLRKQFCQSATNKPVT